MIEISYFRKSQGESCTSVREGWVRDEVRHQFILGANPLNYIKVITWNLSDMEEGQLVYSGCGGM